MVSDFIFHLRDNLAYLRDVKTSNTSYKVHVMLNPIKHKTTVLREEHLLWERFLQGGRLFVKAALRGGEGCKGEHLLEGRR